MEEKIVSLHEIVDNLNSLNLDKEVFVYESDLASEFAGLYPLRIDALLIILGQEGNGRIDIDMTSYEMEPDSLIVLQPRNYISYMGRGEGSNDHCRVRVVGVSPRVVEDVLPRLTDVLPLLMHHRRQPLVKLTRQEAAGLNGFYDFLHAQLEKGPTPFLKQKVICLLQAALYEMMDIANTGESHEMQRTRSEEIMAKFLLAVTQDFREHREVRYYADKLCVTSKHLSTVVKQVSGRTAGEWIDYYVVTEAKVMLRSTDLAVQEVGTRLNFMNQSFFGKYFKHHTGMSPSDFRKKN